MRLQAPPAGGLVSIPVLAWVVVVALLATTTACSGCRVAPRAASTSQSVETPSQAATSPSHPAGVRLVCPTFGSVVVPPALQPNSGHRVILSWKASAPANSKRAAAIGYCVYRSKKDHDASPELVNSVPFSGTSCMDDWVENGSQYNYTVRAISSRGLASEASKTVHAVIPPSPPAIPSGSRAAAPLCRVPVPLK